MKTTTLLFLFSNFWLFNGTVHAQQWLQQHSGFTSAGKTVVDIVAVDEQVGWATIFDQSDPNSLSLEFTRTINGGEDWIPGTIQHTTGMPAFPRCISATDTDNAWVMCLFIDTLENSLELSRIFHTSNGGTTWVPQPSAGFSTPWSEGVSVHFFNVDHGVAIGTAVPGPDVFEIYTTSNGGYSWQMVQSSNIPPVIFGPDLFVEVPQDNFAVSGDTIWLPTDLGRVFRSIDRGMTWTVSQASTASLDLIGNSNATIAFSDHLNGLVIYSDDVTTLVHTTTDGGVTWQGTDHTGTIHSFDLASVPGTPGAYVSVGLQGSSYSSDSGVTWVNIGVGQFTRVDLSGPSTGFAGGMSDFNGTGGVYSFAGSTTAIGEPLAMAAGMIYPNPCTDSFTLRLPEVGTEIGTQNAITLFDMTGRIVLTNALGNGRAGSITVDVQDVPAGVYIADLHFNGQRLKQQLVVE